MSRKRFSSTLITSIVPLLLLVCGPWVLAQDTSSGAATAAGRSAPGTAAGVQKLVAGEIERRRLANLATPLGTYASARATRWQNHMAQHHGQQSTVPATQQVEKKGWWRRNWPYVLALGIGGGFGGAAAAGAFHHDDGNGMSMVGGRP